MGPDVQNSEMMFLSLGKYGLIFFSGRLFCEILRKYVQVLSLRTPFLPETCPCSILGFLFCPFLWNLCLAGEAPDTLSLQPRTSSRA